MSFYETMFYFICGIALIGWGIALYFAKQSDDYFKRFKQEQAEYVMLRVRMNLLEEEYNVANKLIAELQKPKKRAKKVTVTTSNQTKED